MLCAKGQFSRLREFFASLFAFKPYSFFVCGLTELVRRWEKVFEIKGEYIIKLYSNLFLKF